MKSETGNKRSHFSSPISENYFVLFTHYSAYLNLTSRDVIVQINNLILKLLTSVDYNIMSLKKYATSILIQVFRLDQFHVASGTCLTKFLVVAYFAGSVELSVATAASIHHSVRSLTQ